MASPPQRPRGERLVIGITGRIGSGKTTVARYLESNYGFQYLRYSAVLADWLAKDPESKAQLQKVGWEVMAGGMQAELNRRLLAQIAPDGDVAVDGLRDPLDFETLNNSFSGLFRLLFLHTSHEERLERLRKVGKYFDSESFRAADTHLVEQHIDSFRRNATIVIHNEASLPELYAKVDETVRHFWKEGQP